MKIKTAEATRLQLDWLVESIEIARMRAEGEYVKEWWAEEKQTNPSPYSTDWLLGGPIIERERISVVFDRDRVFDQDEAVEQWLATLPMICDAEYSEHGPTPLIAAMRCYCCTELGDEVDIPEELVRSSD